jgi:hypothetical protein
MLQFCRTLQRRNDRIAYHLRLGGTFIRALRETVPHTGSRFSRRVTESRGYGQDRRQAPKKSSSVGQISVIRNRESPSCPRRTSPPRRASRRGNAPAPRSQRRKSWWSRPLHPIHRTVRPVMVGLEVTTHLTQELCDLDPRAMGDMFAPKRGRPVCDEVARHGASRPA